jgi:predicted permease
MRGLRQAIRCLCGTPVFTITTTLILALAVGANTTIFSLLQGLVLRQLPVPGANELVQVATRDRLGREADLTWRQFRELSQHQRVFSTVIASISQGVFTVETDRGERRSSVSGVSGNFFAELGAIPALGRLIQPSDVNIGSAAAERVAVVGWSFWHSQFGADPSIVGQTLKLEGLSLTIIGVAPEGFLGLGVTIEPDITIPLTLVPTVSESESSMLGGTVRWVATTGRLAHGQSLESARAQISAAWPALREAAAPSGLTGALRDEYLATAIEVSSGSRGLERGLRGRYTQPLYALLAIAALVLVASMINLCSLMFARMEARRHEMCVRIALGAPRRRLFKDVATEGALLGLVAAAAGIAFATYASQAIAELLLRDYVVRTSLNVAPDATVVAVAVVASMIIGLTIYLVAAHIVISSASSSLMRGGDRSVSRSWGVGRTLVGAQVAVSLVLVTHAALLARNLQNIVETDSGLTSDAVLIGYPQQRVGAYRKLDPAPYYRQALERVRSIPAVSAAAFSRSRPEGGALPLRPVGRARTPAATTDIVAEVSSVSPGFFESLGLTLLDGRDFTFADGQRGPRVAVISKQLERRLFGAGRGVGQHIRVSAEPEWQDVLVVGVVSDARVYDVRRGNLAIVYTPALQVGDLAHFKWLVVRAPASTSRAVQQALESLGIELLPAMQTLAYVRGRTILQERVMVGLGGYFGALGLLVVMVGLYGILSYLLSLRRKELGIRMALGADAYRVGRAIVADGWRVTGLGVMLGLAGIFASTRFLQRVLVQTSPLDPVAIAGACGVLIAVTTAVSLVPAVRAARVEPLSELRRE